MSKRNWILGLSLVGVCGLTGSKAAAQLLTGNVWPNADFSQIVTSSSEVNGVDQIYSFYNSPFYTPNTAANGDANPRPAGWHRGGNDFGVTTTPSVCLYGTAGNTAGEGTAPTGASGYSLTLNDQSTSGYGEWFSDWNALPASVVSNPGTPVHVRFFYELTNLTSTQRPTDQYRVTVNFGDGVSDDVSSGDPSNLGHTDYTWTIPGTADVTTWTEVDELLVPPAGSQSMRITEDSGGSAQGTGQLYLTNISVAAVPEPGSLLALGTSAMLLIGRRRRNA